jgi:hypothetical protein
LETGYVYAHQFKKVIQDYQSAYEEGEIKNGIPQV